MYYDACDHLQAWELAQALVEVFADNLSDLSLDERLLRHFSNSGWTVEQVDQWLAAKPKGRRGFWAAERLRFDMQHGRGEALEKELTEQVRANPKDTDGVIVFLDVLRVGRVGRAGCTGPGVDGRGRQTKAGNRGQAIASRLTSLGNWKSAAVFYGQAIAVPLTDEEVKRLGRRCQTFVPETTLRAMFAVKTREEFAKCRLGMGQADEAQKLMVEAADIREKITSGTMRCSRVRCRPQADNV